MGRIATFDKKGSHFQRFGLKIFVIAAKAAKAQNLRVRDELLGVVRVGGEKQKHSIAVYVHPPPTYSLRASASFTYRL